MCHLFALSCNAIDRATPSLRRFSEEAWSMSHGWGIGWYENGRAKTEREPTRADFSDLFWNVKSDARSEIIMAHLRWATGTSQIECNCHPFVREYRSRDWMLAHNGFVRGAANQNHPESLGSTDSEQIFNEIIDYVVEYQESGQIRGIYPAIKQAILKIFDTYTRNINLNLLISDGRTLFVFNHYESAPIYMLRREKSYGGAILLTTVPNFTDENWEPIPPDSLIAISGGEIQIRFQSI